MFAPGFEYLEFADGIKRLVCHCTLGAQAIAALLGPDEFVHDLLPGAVDKARIGRCQVSPGDLEVECGLALSLVFGLDNLLSSILVGGGQGGAFSRKAVFAVELPAAACALN